MPVDLETGKTKAVLSNSLDKEAIIEALGYTPANINEVVTGIKLAAGNNYLQGNIDIDLELLGLVFSDMPALQSKFEAELMMLDSSKSIADVDTILSFLKTTYFQYLEDHIDITVDWSKITNQPDIPRDVEEDLYSIDQSIADLEDELADQKKQLLQLDSGKANKSELFSKNYNDLNNLPTLFSGKYTDLTEKPDTFPSDWNTMANKPTIPDNTEELGDLMQQLEELLELAAGYDQSIESMNESITTLQTTKADKSELFSKDYRDLTNTPTIPEDKSAEIASLTSQVQSLNQGAEQTSVSISTINQSISSLQENKANKSELFDKSYYSLTNVPDVFPTNWSSVADKPTFFDGNYNSLVNKPDLFSGKYSDLEGLPELFDGSYESLSDKPELFDGSYDSLSNLPELFDGTWNSLKGRPSLFSGSYADLTDKPDAFPTTWNDVSGKPAFFDGNYSSLANKPTLYRKVKMSGTIQPNQWVNKKFTYSLPNVEMVDDIFFYEGENLSEEEYDAYANMHLSGKQIETGFEITAFGDVPTIPLPFRLIIIQELKE